MTDLQTDLQKLHRAFLALGYAVKWWYRGPGENQHCFTGPEDRSWKSPVCCASPGYYGHQECVRCARAALARATLGREKHAGLTD